MKISALVTSLVLGISSVAVAAPASSAVAQADMVTAVRFAPSPGMHRPSPTRWTLLDTSKASRFGRQVIDINSKQRFTKLKLEATRGVASIDKVLVTFANGRTQVVNVDKRLGGYGAGSSTVIELDGRLGRQIDKITILGKSTARGSYSILGA